MVKKYAITFHGASEPITELVTKFGGQPVWLTAPQWPLSRTTANPMKFVAQIALDPAIFGDILVSYRFVGVCFTPTATKHLNQVRSHVG